MPLFEYSCNACGEGAEVLVRNDKSPLCPHCGASDLEKQLSHIRPMQGGAPEPDGCGAQRCCRTQGGGCMN